MWIFLNKSFLSAVQHPNHSDILVVRARKRDDLKRLFPSRPISSTPSRDYQFRCFVTRKELSRVLVQQVFAIDYGNFKDSVVDDARHDAYSDVWQAMWRWSREPARVVRRVQSRWPLLSRIAAGPAPAVQYATCQFCDYTFDDGCGAYGCPNCEGSPLLEFPTPR